MSTNRERMKQMTEKNKLVSLSGSFFSKSCTTNVIAAIMRSKPNREGKWLFAGTVEDGDMRFL